MPDTIAIIQARMAASRLPGKVLLDLAGAPMLARVVSRAQHARTLDDVLVATTSAPGDDPVADFCRAQGISFFRGSEYDVLDRYYQAARQAKAGTIVRITADCPVIDPGLIDDAVRAFHNRPPVPENVAYLGQAQKPEAGLGKPLDFVANRLPPPWGRTYPIGLDTEVCAFTGLESAWREATASHQREHVMPFFYEQPDRFRIGLLNHSPDYGHLRWTVDTAVDLELLRQIFTHFEGQDEFSWLDVLELFRRNPDLAAINARVQAKDYRLTDSRSQNPSR